MNVSQVERKSLELMQAAQQTEAPQGEGPAGQFSELIKNLLGSAGNAVMGAFGQAPFFAPALHVELKAPVKEEVEAELPKEREEQVLSEEQQAAASEESIEQEKKSAPTTVEEKVVVDAPAEKEIAVLLERDALTRDELSTITLAEKPIAESVKKTAVTQTQPVVQDAQAEMTTGNEGNGYPSGNAKNIIEHLAKPQSDRAVARFAEAVSDTGDAASQLEPVFMTATPAEPAQPAQQDNKTSPHAAIAALHVHMQTGGGAESAASEKSSGNQIAQIGAASDAAERNGRAKKAPAAQLSNREQSNEMVDKIKELIKQANQSKDPNTITVRIEPEALGAMIVKVTQRGDQTYARIIPESSDAEAALRGKINEIVQALQSSGLRTDNVHVSIGHEQSEADFFRFAQFSSFSQGSDDRNQEGSQDERASGNGTADAGWMPAEQSAGNAHGNSDTIQGWIA